MTRPDNYTESAVQNTSMQDQDAVVQTMTAIFSPAMYRLGKDSGATVLQAEKGATDLGIPWENLRRHIYPQSRPYFVAPRVPIYCLPAGESESDLYTFIRESLDLIIVHNFIRGRYGVSDIEKIASVLQLLSWRERERMRESESKIVETHLKEAGFVDRGHETLTLYCMHRRHKTHEYLMANILPAKMANLVFIHDTELTLELLCEVLHSGSWTENDLKDIQDVLVKVLQFIQSLVKHTNVSQERETWDLHFGQLSSFYKDFHSMTQHKSMERWDAIICILEVIKDSWRKARQKYENFLDPHSYAVEDYARFIGAGDVSMACIENESLVQFTLEKLAPLMRMGSK
jgi:hypothetical protein